MQGEVGPLVIAVLPEKDRMRERVEEVMVHDIHPEVWGLQWLKPPNKGIVLSGETG